MSMKMELESIRLPEIHYGRYRRRRDLIMDACFPCYQKMMAETPDVTDDTMVVERYGNEVVKVVEGGYFNIKITTPEDMKIGLEILKNFDAFLKKKKC